jgi:hypothetical protein
MFSDHLHFGAELFVATNAEIADATANEIVDTDVITRRNVSHLLTNSFDPTGDLVPKSDRQRIDRRYAGAIMGVGVADSAGGDADQDVSRADL